MKLDRDVSMATLGTFQLGGPCRQVVRCSSADEVVEAMALVREEDQPHVLIGGGSNLLFSDHGFEGTVIQFLSDIRQLSLEGDVYTLPAGVSLDAFVAKTVSDARSGLVSCSGIPGTVGGAIVGNAGAWGDQVGDVLHSVELLRPDGIREWVAAETLEFAYRHSRLKECADVVLAARFGLPAGDAAGLLTRREEILALRHDKHPDLAAQPCIGSIFRNVEPTSAAGRRQAAGWFLDEAGGRALQVGGAEIFEKHANIIVKGEGCTAQDVHDLTLEMQALVRRHFNFELKREVRFLGSFEGTGPQPAFF